VTRAWFLKGKTPEILCPVTYEKIGINGTINMETGQVYSTIADKFNADSFLLFIKNLIPNIPHGKKFVMILDNARPHHAKKVTEYVEKNVSNLKFLFLPPYSPNLNPAENVWKLLRKKATHNVYFDSLKSLYSKVENTLEEFAKPNISRKNYCAVI
jgi:transposase